jgi:hypothetical protein
LVNVVVFDSLNLVHALDGGISLILIREAHEAKATAATGIAVLDDNLKSAMSVLERVSMDMRIYVLQLPQQRQTPRTLCAEQRRQCARQGRCRRKLVQVHRRKLAQTYPMKSLDMMIFW